MSAFKDDLAEKMKNPEFAYEYGRTERELEIVKLLEDLDQHGTTHSEFCAARHAYAAQAIAFIKGENIQEPAVSTNHGQGRKQMPFTWEVYGNPSDGLWECLICGSILQLKYGVFGEGALDVHRQNHLDNALIKGENNG